MQKMRQLDSKIYKAVQILWIDRDLDKGGEAMRLFEESAAEGNADAYYFLARCYAGESYVDVGFGFPEDDAKAYAYLDKSIEQGSALGMFAARRFGGYKPKGGTFVHEPYHSSKEIWDEVCGIAESGELFTKYLVANAYYYGDVAKLTEVDFSNVTKQQLDAQFRKWAEIAMKMYDELIAKNMIMGIGNYIDIITCGDYGVPKDEKKARELRHIGAEKGNPFYMIKVGQEYEETQPNKAEEYYRRALAHNYPLAGYYLGKLYTFGGKLTRNIGKAKELFENCLAAGEEKVGCNNRLGEIYFYGGEGVAVDYDKAFRHLLAAHDGGNYWGSDMLGTCYLKGYGTTVDYAKAREELSRYKGETLSAIGLGEIYAYGLGVPADIKTGMSYWSKFPNHSAVIEHKKNFKKTLFGWKRIQ